MRGGAEASRALTCAPARIKSLFSVSHHRGARIARRRPNINAWLQSRRDLKYNPKATDRRHEGAGAMQQPRSWWRSRLPREATGSIATKQIPGAVSRPGTIREFQFREYADL
jgi:hypothetical protein